MQYHVYKIKCLSLYYIGFTSSLASRVDTHKKLIKAAVRDGTSNAHMPFYKDILKERQAASLSTNDVMKTFQYEVLRATTSKVRAMCYEERHIQDCIDDPNCSNVLSSYSCRLKGRVCVTETEVEGGIFKCNFCPMCGHPTEHIKL